MRRVLSFDMGTRNLAFALVESPRTVLRMGLIDLCHNDARKACEFLLNTLHGDNSWMLECCDEVVVESQPSAGVHRILTFVLQTHFMDYDLLHRKREPRPFRFMHARSKLALFPDIFERSQPRTYNQRKACAMEQAERILNDEHCTPTRFKQFYDARNRKQKTDLADALIQACVHLDSIK